MPENILVVEYEPRYTDRVRQALAGQPFAAFFAKDGEEAVRSLEAAPPSLIVLSSVIPKISTSELIRVIRGRKPLQDTPILLTVSGYNGKSPKQDAVRMGASDILPKPYSEGEFLGKVQQMLGIRSEHVSSPQWAPAELEADFTARDIPAATVSGQQLTSNEIFGDLVDDDRSVAAGARKSMSKQKDDLDKMLADTLSGMRPSKKKEGPVASAPAPAPPQPAAPPKPPAAPQPPAAAAPPAPPAPAQTPSAAKPAEAKPSRTQSGAHDLDKMLHDTLSGLEKTNRRPTVPQSTPVPPPAAAPRPAPAAPPAPSRPAAPPPPAPAAPAASAASAQRFNTARIPAYVADKVPAAQPVFPQAAPEPVKVEEDEADGIKFGQYLLIEKIATGGMAEVWKARMRGVEGFQKIVAIKKILPHLSDNQDFIEMFVDEAKLAAQLNHNNIIHIYDLGKIQSSYYIAMEYIDGYDLKTILRRGHERDQPMQVELALFIASKIAAALDYAHRKRDFEDRDMGLVHRDVSPQNVLISEEGDIKLCDFGIAKAASKASHTQAGALKGKLQYMSPEQAWGRNIDKRSDIFALATVLFEMLTGRKLFTGDNELSILEQVREARVTAPSEFNDEVTHEIDAIVLKALHKDPANRYQTAGEMARDIDAILYSFKPTPTSADLAIYMHRIYSPDMALPEPEPFPEAKPAPAAIVPSAPLPVAPHAAPAAAIPPVANYDQPIAAPKKSPVPLIAIAAVLLLAIGGVIWFMMKGKSAEPAATTTAPAATPAATGTIAPATTASAAPTTTAPTTAIDPSLVDQEVAKRLAAERARLEQQARQAGTTTAAPARPTPTPAAPAPVPVVQQPPPQVAETRPAPAPVQQTPAPVVEQPAPQPAAPAPAPAAARAREGDLIPAGTEGLVAARVVKRGSVPYPPVAKMQRVEGTVIVSVLVSETGQPIDTKILRGVNRPVGLNEAAEQAMRRSTFAPATKDGVRVKTWLTVPVDFKL